MAKKEWEVRKEVYTKKAKDMKMIVKKRRQ